jgi:hypothetical protein
VRAVLLSRQYLESRGFHVIVLPAAIQLALGVNVLNIGHGKVIITHQQAARMIAADPHFTGSLYYVPFTEITAMYGSVHCATFVCRYPPGAMYSLRTETAGMIASQSPGMLRRSSLSASYALAAPGASLMFASLSGGQALRQFPMDVCSPPTDDRDIAAPSSRRPSESPTDP